jgi:hypothetical protein
VLADTCPQVKRLLQKKRAGRLIVALDSPDHVDEL